MTRILLRRGGARRGVATDDEIEYLERFNMPSGPGGGDGSG